MIFLQIGSNIGNRYSNLLRCLENIELSIGKIIKKSKIYVSECWGVENQRDYLNMVVAIKAIQKPTEVLKNILIIENDMGRVRKKKWDSRIIDIDIIFYENLSINQNGLVIPHPRMQSRHFVLIPMCDLNPDFIHPILGLKTSKLLDELEIRNDIVDINFSLED